MPDPAVILQASFAAGAVAAIVLLLARCAFRCGLPVPAYAAWPLAVAAGFWTGAWKLGLAPHWPPREDQDRLQLVVVPMVVAVETVLALIGQTGRFARLLRGVAAFSIAPILLFGSVYMSDPAIAGTAAWSGGQRALLLSLLGALAFAVWLANLRLAQRGSASIATLSLALAVAAAGVAIMLSGYASGGQLAFPLTAALTGGLVGSLSREPSERALSAVGMGVVGLIAMLILGCCFGNLSTAAAAGLLAAPLLGWTLDLPGLGRLHPIGKSMGRLALTVVPLAIVIGFAVQKFNVESRGQKGGPAAPASSLDDYMNFGK